MIPHEYSGLARVGCGMLAVLVSSDIRSGKLGGAMHISQLRIKNFRNFANDGFEIRLRPFTLIIGENNIGKTNLVSALALLFGQDISNQSSKRLSLDDINYATVRDFKKQVADTAIGPDKVVFPEVEIEADLVGMNDAQHSVVADWYTDNTLESARITYRFAIRGSFDREKWVNDQRDALVEQEENSDEPLDASSYVDFPVAEYRHTLYGGGVGANECDSYLLGLCRMEFLDALRDAGRELAAGGENRVLYRILNHDSETKYTDLKSSLAAVKRAVDSNKALAGLKAEVAELLKNVSLASETDDHTIAFQFTAPDAAELLKKVGLVYGVDPVTIERNGLGRNNLLYVALVISQIARTDDPAKDRERYVCFRVVGVEEPEAHLHPHLQDHLARNVEDVRKEHDEGLQLLLTSHSTHLAAKIALENTAVVFRGEDGKLMSRYVLDGVDIEKEKDSVRFLSLYLDATKSRLLFARSVILVEGIAEQTLVPLLFEQEHGRTLESIGCSVVNVGGVAFKHFLTVIKNGMFRRCIVLTDSDEKTASENRAKDLHEDYHDGRMVSIHISKRSTFEKDLIEANAKTEGKTLLLDALALTKTQDGPAYRTAYKKKRLDVEDFFARIERHKAAFAFNLATMIAKNTVKKLTVPDYISKGLKFVASEGTA